MDFKVDAKTLSLVGKIAGGVAAAGVLYTTLPKIRTWTFKRLLHYNTWMFHPKSTRTKLYITLTAFLGGREPTTFAFQDILPPLPVPPVEKTLTKYLASVRPILNDKEFAETQAAVQEFLQSGDAHKLNYFLNMRKLEKIDSSWLEEWWEEFVYLRPREPIAVLSNWYGSDRPDPLPSTQADRAARLISSIMNFWQMLNNGELDPIRISGAVPLCMDQYKRLFSTSRVPGVEKDSIVRFPDESSRHVVVIRKGQFYRLNLWKANGERLEPADIWTQLNFIIKDADSGTEVPIGTLTGGNRTAWAQERERLLTLSERNRESIEAIESALFAVVLETESPNTNVGICRSMWHGDGQSRWFDKSFQLVVTENGYGGVNGEHSFADAPIIAHCLDYAFISENGEVIDHSVARPLLAPPRQLKFDTDAQTEKAVSVALTEVTKLIQSVDLHILIFKEFGKGFIKSLGVSPDGFIQMALQLAYYRTFGEFVLTYESAQTRMFHKGRTATVRSCTNDAAAFVKAMCDSTATREQRVALLKTATETHVRTMREAMIGHDVDRPLFGLRIAAGGAGIMPSIFKDKAWNLTWRLSTSQTPARKTVGGGFAPVTPDGFGVSYVVHEEELLFHVTSYLQYSEAKVLADAIKAALVDMQNNALQDKKLTRALSAADIRRLGEKLNY
eukprot:TRINITY_DN1707_c0_g1_i2.p1 TRINITY_DN1707_c0_g1~~TRINITY_DN1707_c0_g1_i2.p1  ORF type:complete len:673 (+),score=225.54 TRINITY_DN1707_c0_g1_i2:140-2158(+)